MLSKLPHEVLLMTEEREGEGEGGEVCLHHKVLTTVCDLFDRYVEQWTLCTDSCIVNTHPYLYVQYKLYSPQYHTTRTVPTLLMYEVVAMYHVS